MPATSQKQERFMNFVHAVQKGKASAKGYPKVQETAKTMEPSSVEHFMGRGHIDKDLPKQAAAPISYEHYDISKDKEALAEHSIMTQHPQLWLSMVKANPKSSKLLQLTRVENPEQLIMNKQAFERGFLKAAIDNNVHPTTALNLLKQAFSGDGHGNIIARGAGEGAALGGMGGAGVGAGLGAGAGAAFGIPIGVIANLLQEQHQSEKEKRDPRYFAKGLTGAIKGGVVGPVVGGLAGAGIGGLTGLGLGALGGAGAGKAVSDMRQR